VLLSSQGVNAYTHTRDARITLGLRGHTISPTLPTASHDSETPEPWTGQELHDQKTNDKKVGDQKAEVEMADNEKAELKEAHDEGGTLSMQAVGVRLGSFDAFAKVKRNSIAGSMQAATRRQDLERQPSESMQAATKRIKIFRDRMRRLRQDMDLEAETTIPLAGETTIPQEEQTTNSQQTAAAHRLNVVYGIIANPASSKYALQLTAVEETWAKDVHPQKILFVGSNGSAPGVTYDPAPMCPDANTAEHWGLACKEATLIATAYATGADWAVVAYPDNYIFPRSYEEALGKFDSTEPQIVGGDRYCGGARDNPPKLSSQSECEDNLGGLCGGSTYAVSRGAMEKMMGMPRTASSYIKEVIQASKISVLDFHPDMASMCVARRYGVKEVGISGLHNFLHGLPSLTSAMMSSSMSLHYVLPEEMRQIHEKMQTMSSSPGRWHKPIASWSALF